MCWISKIRPIIRVADSGILVEKVLRLDDGVLCSPVYSESRWEIGKEYTCEMGDYYNRNMSLGSIFGYADMSLDDFEVREGFHSCREISQDSYSWLSVSALGNYEMFYHHFNEYIYSAVIPSGSKYYLNEYGEYVSDRLRIIGKKDCVINNKIKLRYGED